MNGDDNRAYVLVGIQPGKEQEFANEIALKGLKQDSIVERMDFVHGSFDFIIVFNGSGLDIDRRILEIRLLPYVQRTETLIPFKMLNWSSKPKKRKRS
jgi:hypothetical protein